MKVSEALGSRMSCRAFLPDPVPEALLRQILAAASRAPSGGNLQPWFVDVLTGAPLAALLERVRVQVPEHPLGHPSEYPVYPSPLGEPYRTRRHQNGEDLYATIGIPRSDRPARLRQFARNATRPLAHPWCCSSASNATWVRPNGPTWACSCKASCCSHASMGCTPARRNPGPGSTPTWRRPFHCRPAGCSFPALRWVTATNPRRSTGSEPSVCRWRNLFDFSRLSVTRLINDTAWGPGRRRRGTRPDGSGTNHTCRRRAHRCPPGNRTPSRRNPHPAAFLPE